MYVKTKDILKMIWKQTAKDSWSHWIIQNLID